MEKCMETVPLRGRVTCIASKSYGHRILLAAALAQATGGRVPAVRLQNGSEDMAATRRALAKLLAATEIDSAADVPAPANTPAPSAPAADDRLLDCGESGTTLRLLVPVAAALLGRKAGETAGDVQAQRRPRRIGFTGHGRLMQRPMAPLLRAMEPHGVAFEQAGETLWCCGSLRPGSYTIPANVSSQYISGLLFALPLLPGDSTLTLTGPVASRAYIEMTLSVLRQFGIRIGGRWMEGQPAEGERGIADAVRPSALFQIPGGQTYSGPETAEVEGDWSNAAFWLAAGAIGGGPVTVDNLNLHSLQGDKAILAILNAFGACVETDAAAGTVTVSRCGPLHGVTVDVEQTPDLAPVLAVVAATAKGESRLLGAARLRMKESDRLQTTAALVTALGGRAEEGADSLTIYGGWEAEPDRQDSPGGLVPAAPVQTPDAGEKPLQGGTVDGAGDHRIVMAAAVAAAACRTPVRILGAEAVNKSYPGFFEERETLIWQAPTANI